uniref:Reverse transcriptase/retrotransposon-derived protein RNase H-like domain-containing protein n=1 Tax=Tanacetum cinerariifolium TaxID=118510 RepID=A0A6L2KMI9_TANCI|nr:hypothetical protein [Tanacetum cinerariifolium]
MGWVVCSNAIVESCDTVLIIVVTASRYICDVVSSHCREILEQCWCRLGDKEKNVSAHTRGSERKSYYNSCREAESCYQSSSSKEIEIASEKHRYKREYSRRTEAESESEGSAGGHWKSKPKKQKSNMEDDVSQPWVCEETNPFTPRIGYFDFPKTQMPSHIKTYDGSEDPEDHLKIFQAAAKTERYNDLKKVFLENYLQQKKCIKDLVEIHNIKQRNGESTKEFVRRGALHMQISGFMHEITNPELIKRLHEKIPQSMDEMMSVTATFLRGKMAASNRERKKNASKFCEFHGEVGHTTDECMHLKRQIDEMLKAGKLSHLIKELKQNNRKVQAKTAKKGETSRKDKPLAILVVQPWQRIARQRITQTFSSGSLISFLTLREEDRTKDLMIIEAEMGGHCVHRIYVDGGSSLEILADIVASKDRRRGTLNIHSDEFHGGKITLSLQRDYRKAGEEDEEKTAFITSQGIFYYSKMPLGLKNARATYQRLVDKDFQKQIGQNLEINMKLNPKKCAFGMREGTFLGYKVDADGLRVSLDKVKAVIDLPSPKCLKDVQKLNEKLAKEAFKEMKQSIAELPMLTAPKEKEELIIYLAAAKEAISAMLMTEREGKQVPIYFVSRALQGPEVNYTPMEKLILALVSAIKGQILVDFIVERPEDGTLDTPMEDREELSDPWILFIDGSSCVDGSEASLITMNPKGMEFTYALRFGLPGEVISDNGKQFSDNPFKDWSLGEGIKARLGEKNKNWVEEISHVLWAHRTIIKSSNEKTPFSLTYGTKAVIPAKIGMPTLRTAEVDEARSKARMEGYYNARFQNTSFRPGDLVYRNNEASHAEDGGKLGPKWEGTYEVTEALGKGAYKLKDRNGHTLPRTWNIRNLKKCYIHEM